MRDSTSPVPALFRIGFAVNRAGWAWVGIGVVLAAHRELGPELAERAARLAEFGALCVLAGRGLQIRAVWKADGRG